MKIPVTKLLKQYFIQANTISFIFNILFNLPMALYKPYFYKTPVFCNNFLISLLIELSIVFLFNNILFFIILCSRHLSYLITGLLFSISSIAVYFLISYKKLVDTGAIVDALSVEHELITDYINLKLILVIILSSICGVFLPKLSNLFCLQKYIKSFLIINIILSTLTIGVFFSAIDNPRLLRFIAKDYLPYSLITNCYNCYYDYLPKLKQKQDKDNIPQKHPAKLIMKNQDPLVVVLVIGESMRGDLLSINGYAKQNMPLMEQTPNLISFAKASSSANSTKISIPYMLTSAVPPNFDQALSELSIISMFKSLGFATSWIGSQGAFSQFETTYASIILEADYFIFQPHVREKIKARNNYDGDLLEFIKERLSSIKENHLMIVHLLGSHWHFNERYPRDFSEKFLPTCTNKDKDLCTNEMIMNSYHNTILYTDYVMSQLISYLKPLNSFLLYASDHGFTFSDEGEGFFGNAYVGENPPEKQLHIGMFVWASNQYIQNNSANYQNILLKKEQSVSHDYIYHSLLGCNNIISDIIENKFNLCFPSH